MTNDQTSSFPTHAAASKITAAARRMGYVVSRHAGGPSSRSAYVMCGKITVRIADHPTDKRIDIDVHTDLPRAGSVTTDKAIEWLRGKL
jgi:hypothetical protein